MRHVSFHRIFEVHTWMHLNIEKNRQKRCALREELEIKMTLMKRQKRRQKCNKRYP